MTPSTTLSCVLVALCACAPDAGPTDLPAASTGSTGAPPATTGEGSTSIDADSEDEDDDSSSSSSGGGDDSTTTSGAEGSSSSTGAAGSPAGTIIPLYTYPTDATWTTVAALQTSYPEVEMVAIINPASGPGLALDPNYDAGIDMLQMAGVIVVGYVHTSYGARPLVDVEGDVSTYAAFYGQLDGIMFDEMSTVAGDAAYYSAVADAVADAGLSLTLGNPGTTVPEALLGIFDTVFVYEGVGLPDPDALGVEGHDRSEFAVIPHAVATLDPEFVAAALERVGFVYVTDDVLPNPWDTLPTYFDELVAALAEG
jgi:hypothetical protein